MTTAAPKLPRSRWLSMRSTPKRFPVRPLRNTGPNRYQASDGRVYSRVRDTRPGKQGPLVRVRTVT